MQTQFQSLNRTRHTAHNRQNTAETQQVQLLSKCCEFYMPVVVQRRQWSSQYSQLQQLQFIDEVFEIPILTQITVAFGDSTVQAVLGQGG